MKAFLLIAALLGLGGAAAALVRKWQQSQSPTHTAAPAETATARGGTADTPAEGISLRALLVGINAYEKAPLRGCVNDVKLLHSLLQETFGLSDDNARVLLDEQATRAAIEDGLRWLAQSDGSSKPQVRLFHFSGHGVQVPDKNGDEPDGADEALAQYDYQTAGVMTDDVLRELYNQFSPDTHLLLTMDCCHSGSIHFAPVTEDVVERYLEPSQEELDQIEEARRTFEEHQFERRQTIERQLEAQNVPANEREAHIQRELEAARKKQRFGEETSRDFVVLLSAARADQTAADARFEQDYHGALSYYLSQTLREYGASLTYAALHERVSQAIAGSKFSQVPQLECSPANLTRTFLGGSPGTATAAPAAAAAAPTATPQPGNTGSDEDMTRDLPPEFFEDMLPLTDAEDEGDTPRDRSGFQFIGKGMKAGEFTEYVNSYDFGTQPPSFVVIHHTYIPDTLHARAQNATWDSGEDGMSEAQIYQKRLRQLTGVKNYYQNQLNWTRGPHLFIDDRWIWLFTPMYYQGIHAAAGNGDGRGVYSIGIEVVGHYAKVRWPEPVENLVGHAVAVLKQRLNTFEIKHQPMAGGVSGHRDYNKPSCPGDAITNEYYIGVLQRAWERLQSGEAPAAAKPKPAPKPPATALPADPPLLGEATGSQEHAVAYIQKNLPGNHEYADDANLIMSYYWKYAPPVGIDPFLAASQCIFETDSLRSDWAARPRRNPAGLGVRQEGGLSFDTWENSVQAHIGQLLAFALTDEEANDAQKQMMAKNPRHDKIAAEHRGQARTMAGLNNRWTSDAKYATGLLNRMKDIRGG